MQVTGLGRISVYEPRGTYQIILEYMEPKGAGAIQVAFEQLKARLLDEGLFDEIFSWDHINERLRSILTTIIYKKWTHLKEEADRDKDS